MNGKFHKTFTIRYNIKREGALNKGRGERSEAREVQIESLSSAFELSPPSGHPLVRPTANRRPYCASIEARFFAKIIDTDYKPVPAGGNS